jgi:hypothetical protein
MPGAKYCSECGEALPAGRARLLTLRATCAQCAPRLRFKRLMMVAGFALCLAISFMIGRNTTPRQPFYLLGTPIDPQTSASDSGATSQPPETNKPLADDASHAAGSPGTVATICGAPTKSGKPCQRKVAGGGYCWQHRDKYGAKQKASNSN